MNRLLAIRNLVPAPRYVSKMDRVPASSIPKDVKLETGTLQWYLPKKGRKGKRYPGKGIIYPDGKGKEEKLFVYRDSFARKFEGELPLENTRVQWEKRVPNKVLRSTGAKEIAWGVKGIDGKKLEETATLYQKKEHISKCNGEIKDGKIVFEYKDKEMELPIEPIIHRLIEDPDSKHYTEELIANGSKVEFKLLVSLDTKTSGKLHARTFKKAKL